jgi:hypothetical protein
MIARLLGSIPTLPPFSRPAAAGVANGARFLFPSRRFSI